MKRTSDPLGPASLRIPNPFITKRGDHAAAQKADPVSPLQEPDDLPDDELQTPADDDDAKWDVFLPDDDELDPLPDHRDIWFEPD